MISSSNLLAPTPINIDGGIIHQDKLGRFCLNDLHQASGGEQKKQPRYFLENKQTQDLVQALVDSGIPLSPVEVVRGGSTQGTYVVKQIVYAYAMWISAKFHLKVINTFDAVVNQKQLPDLNNPSQLRDLLLGYAEQNIQLTTENQVLTKAIETITSTEHGVKFQQACKILDVKQHVLAKWLREHGWDRYINKSRASTHYSQERDYCETKFEEVDGVKPSGQPYNYTKIEFFILPKGMALLAKHFGEAV